MNQKSGHEIGEIYGIHLHEDPSLPDGSSHVSKRSDGGFDVSPEFAAVIRKWHTKQSAYDRRWREPIGMK